MTEDYEKMLEEYKAMAEMYKRMADDLSESRRLADERADRAEKKLEDLLGKMDRITEVMVEEKRIYEKSDVEILFDELIKMVDSKIEANVPETVKTTVKKRGEKVGLISVFGYERLEAAFCTTYPKLLETILRLPDDAPPEDRVGYDEAIEFIISKCDKYTGIIETDPEEEWGEYSRIKSEYKSFVRENTRIKMSGEPLSKDRKYRETVLDARFKAVDKYRDRVTRYLRDGGMFLLYLKINRIEMEDVDADTFVEFQDMFVAKMEPDPKISTINELRKNIMPFFEHLSKELKTRKPYLATIPRKDEGSIPVRRHELDTRPKATEAFGMEFDERMRLERKTCEICDVYECIRTNKIGRDPELLEIIVRILRETGLRPEFALRLRWGGFTSEPASEVRKYKVYKLILGELSDLTRGRKGIPHYNMYISELLGDQINQYRLKHPEIDNHYRVFSGVKLIGWKEERYGEVMDRDALRKHVMLLLSEECGIRVRADKLRNSYFTVMLDALNVTEDDAFKRWTGDLRSTAVGHYEAVVDTVRLPEIARGKMKYSEIVARIFGKEDIPVCISGELSSPRICPDGKLIFRKKCVKGELVDSGQRCRGG